MVTTLLLCSALAAAAPASADHAAYEAAKVQAGRDADAHVRLALWCEQHGMTAERLKHLALAVLIDPKNATARGLMGLVAFQGRWQRPEQVQADAALAAALADYNGRRARLPNTADAHWKLALWCEENGLKAEATAHLTAVARLDPGREAAWKRLGCKKHNGRWMTEAQIAAERAELDAQKKADKKWRPLLSSWSAWLGKREKRADAETLLAGVDDPRAVPSIVAVFVGPDLGRQAVAVRVLGQIDSPASSRALALLAVLSASAEVRRTATETLRRRDAREYADLLIAMLRDPIKYQVRPVGGPGSPGAIFVAGKLFNVQRLYAPPAAPLAMLPPGGAPSTDWAGLPTLVYTNVDAREHVVSGLTEAQALQMARADALPAAQVPAFLVPYVPGAAQFNAQSRQAATVASAAHIQALQQRIHQQIAAWPAGTKHPTVNAHREVFTQSQTTIPIGQMMIEAQKSALAAQQHLQRDVATLDQYNQAVGASNDEVAKVLNDATGQSRPADAKDWTAWWIDQLGYRSDLTTTDAPVPTFVEQVPLDYVPQPAPIVTNSVTTQGPITDFRRISCFGKGTMVRTLAGPQPIETLRVGDRVLTQEIASGALRFQPVLVAHHNPPSATFLIRLAGETVVSSPFHRFWKPGRGWVMARDLKAGDRLRVLDGLATVESVESGPVQPVYNLDVAEDHDFFVGGRGSLVHDNTLPNLRTVPFDAGTAPATIAQAVRPASTAPSGRPGPIASDR